MRVCGTDDDENRERENIRGKGAKEGFSVDWWAVKATMRKTKQKQAEEEINRLFFITPACWPTDGDDEDAESRNRYIKRDESK
jgi:hypothetical protein